MAEMAWTLVPKGHQTRPHRMGAGIELSAPRRDDWFVYIAALLLSVSQVCKELGR
jgi:hypothetical protein